MDDARRARSDVMVGNVVDNVDNVALGFVHIPRMISYRSTPERAVD